MISEKSHASNFSDLNQLKSQVGRKLGTSSWLTITQQRINDFADATDDHQWIHLDEVKARQESPYGETIAHGFLVLSLGPKLIAQCYHVDTVVMAINYGLDRVRFMRAVPANAQIRTHVTLLEADPKESSMRCKLRVSFELKGSEKPACIAEQIVLLYER